MDNNPEEGNNMGKGRLKQMEAGLHWGNDDTALTLSLLVLLISRIVNTVAIDNNRNSCFMTNKLESTDTVHNHLQPVKLPSCARLKQMTLR